MSTLPIWPFQPQPLVSQGHFKTLDNSKHHLYQISSCTSLHQLVGARSTGGKAFSYGIPCRQVGGKRESLSFYCPSRPAASIYCL
jgi:hypothetical protein